MLVIHGTPITPKKHLDELDGHSFCVSYAHRGQLADASGLIPADGMLLLDNGAFTTWRQGRSFDESGFWDWANEVMESVPQAVAVIPDVIGGSEEQNWLAAARAVRGGLAKYPERCMYIWHTNDSMEILQKACLLFNFVGIGSCEAHDIQRCWREFYSRIREANAVIEYVDQFCGRRPWIHVMRGLGKASLFARFDSADSSNLARNHWRHKGAENHVWQMARRIEASATKGQLRLL